MNLITQNGYDLLEVISALQKEIRGSDEEKALYWALELVPNYEVYLWCRFTVIVNEDIGIANPPLLYLIPTQGEVFFGFREQGKDGIGASGVGECHRVDVSQCQVAARRSFAVCGEPGMSAAGQAPTNSRLRVGQAHGTRSAHEAELRSLA